MTGIGAHQTFHTFGVLHDPVHFRYIRVRYGLIVFHRYQPGRCRRLFPQRSGPAAATHHEGDVSQFMIGGFQGKIRIPVKQPGKADRAFGLPDSNRLIGRIFNHENRPVPV